MSLVLSAANPSPLPTAPKTQLCCDRWITIPCQAANSGSVEAASASSVSHQFRPVAVISHIQRVAQTITKKTKSPLAEFLLIQCISTKPHRKTVRLQCGRRCLNEKKKKSQANRVESFKEVPLLFPVESFAAVCHKCVIRKLILPPPHAPPPPALHLSDSHLCFSDLAQLVLFYSLTR